jgi:hypothetical protein
MERGWPIQACLWLEWEPLRWNLLEDGRCLRSDCGRHVTRTQERSVTNVLRRTFGQMGRARVSLAPISEKEFCGFQPLRFAAPALIHSK